MTAALPSSARSLRSLVHYGAGLGMRGIETLGKLGLYVYAGHKLGAHDAGLFFLCLTWIGLAATAARLGLDKAMTRHIAAELAVGDGPRARAALRYGLGLTALAAVAAAGLTALIARPAAAHIFTLPDLAVPLLLSAAVIVPQTLAFSLGAALAGFGRGVAAQLVQNALWPALTFAALILWIDDIAGLILVLAAALTASCLLGFALLLRERARLRERQPRDTAVAPMPGLWETALPLLTVEVTQVALASLPVLILGMIAEAATVGAFSMASRISMLIWVVIISIGTLAAPRFAGLHRLGQIGELRRYNRMVRLGVAGVGLPAILIMLLFPASLLGLISPDFAIAATALQILAIGQAVNCLLACQDVLLSMTGHHRLLRNLNLLQLAVGVVLSAVLIPALGINGAALVASLSLAQGAIGTSYYSWRFILREKNS